MKIQITAVTFYVCLVKAQFTPVTFEVTIMIIQCYHNNSSNHSEREVQVSLTIVPVMLAMVLSHSINDPIHSSAYLYQYINYDAFLNHSGEGSNHSNNRPSPFSVGTNRYADDPSYSNDIASHSSGCACDFGHGSSHFSDGSSNSSDHFR